MPEQRSGRLEVAPEEWALLRRAFRRLALPYLGGAVALVAAFFWLAPSGPAPLGASPEPAGLEALTAEVAALREELATLGSSQAGLARAVGANGSRLEEIEARGAGSNVATASSGAAVKSLEKRAAATARRLDQLEARPQLGGSVANASADSGEALERLQNVERRQKVEEESLRRFKKELLDRVYGIEASRDQRVADRTALERSLLNRLANVEHRVDSVESSSDAAPAAPAPR